MLKTNFSKELLPKYRKAIVDFQARTGSDRLYIKAEALDCDGRIIHNSLALHDRENTDIGIFWQIFDAIIMNEETNLEIKSPNFEILSTSTPDVFNGSAKIKFKVNFDDILEKPVTGDIIIEWSNEYNEIKIEKWHIKNVCTEGHYYNKLKAIQYIRREEMCETRIAELIEISIHS